MLDADSSNVLHAGQNILLVILSVALLPISTFVLFLSYGIQAYSHGGAGSEFRDERRNLPGFRPRTVLVTGVGMAKGLRIARAFYQMGHRVIGADVEPYGVPVNGRVSKAVEQFYRVTQPETSPAHYVRDLVCIAEREQVDLWVSCSGAVFPVEDGEAKELMERSGRCKCIQYDARTTELLDDKNSFNEYLKNLGLPYPGTFKVTSQAEVHDILHRNGDKHKYILKSIALDDLARVYMDILPRQTPSQTHDHVSKLPISEKSPWVLQQYVQGEEYCTHSIVIDGKVKIFTACPSSELVIHYQPLPASSPLYQAFYLFTRNFAAKAGVGFTGHLSFDFIVEEKLVDGMIQKKIYPIECNPRTHTAVVLFSGVKGSQDMVDGYLGVFKESNDTVMDVTRKALGRPLANHNVDHPDEGSVDKIEDVPHPEEAYPGHYWIGNDVVTLLLLPLYRLMTWKLDWRTCLEQIATFFNHAVFWKDATYELWDPLPWWFLYHVYWPGQFLACAVTGKRWSRVNVSTKRILTC